MLLCRHPPIYANLSFEIKKCSGRFQISQKTLIRILNIERDKIKIVYDDLKTVKKNEAQSIIDQALTAKNLFENKQLRIVKR